MTLETRALTKSFGNFTAVNSVNLTLAAGKVLSLLGPSGCGKTTTLRMIAGFEQPTSGHVYLAGRDITNKPARRRNIGMVFQSYALFPHLNAAENVAFGLHMRRVGRSERDSRVARALDMVRMKGFGDRLPKSLSGGQQQRIALARALVIEPDLLLLDEPLSALDLKLREEMRDEIHRIVRELGTTTVFVTHDQGEALVLSDLVAVMNAGRVEQMASPREVYRKPATAFVADFIGGANVVHGRADPANVHVFVAEGGLSLTLQKPLPQGATALSIRPEDIGLRPGGSEGIAAMVRRSRFLGNAFDYTVALANGRTLNVRTDGHTAYMEGDRVALVIDTGRLTVLKDPDKTVSGKGPTNS
jgi:ABC-type Fe3+/spermidine/putrescine transport system ATPase subunit